MGHFSNDYEHASADLVDYYSQPISYSDPSLEAVDIDAAVYPEKAERRQNDHGWYWLQTRKVVLLNSDVTVRSDGKVTVIAEGKDYAIETIAGGNGGRTILGLARAQAAEVNRPGYRGGR